MKLALALALFAWLTTGVRAHDWYPPECCSDRDCKPVTCDSITETKDGFVQGGLTYRRDQVRATQDRKCHACVNFGRPLCLFIMPST